MDREVLIYVDLRGAPVLAGRLWSRVRKGRESASFEYDPGWLAHPEHFALEPALALAPGPFHETAEYYGLKPKDAKSIAREVGLGTAGWRGEAKRLGIGSREVERMASAFEHEDSRKAAALA